MYQMSVLARIKIRVADAVFGTGPEPRLGGRTRRLCLNEKRTFAVADGCDAARQRAQTCQFRGQRSGFRGGAARERRCADAAARRFARIRANGSFQAQVEENGGGTLRAEMRTATLRNFARIVGGPVVPGLGEAGSPKRLRCWRKSRSAAGWHAGSASGRRTGCCSLIPFFPHAQWSFS